MAVFPGLLLLLVSFFTNRHNRVRNVIEKAIRNQSFENNGMHIYLLYDQQFRNKGGKALTKEKKKRCTLKTWCQKTLQTYRKGRPAGNLTWCEPHSDHLEYLTRQHITKIHPPKHRTSWDSYHASPRKKCDFRHALGALLYTSQFRKYQKT